MESGMTDSSREKLQALSTEYPCKIAGILEMLREVEEARLEQAA